MVQAQGFRRFEQRRVSAGQESKPCDAKGPRLESGPHPDSLHGCLVYPSVNRGKFSVEGAAEQIDRGDDRKCDTRCDQTVFDRRCPRLIGPEPKDVMLQLSLPLEIKLYSTLHLIWASTGECPGSSTRWTLIPKT